MASSTPPYISCISLGMIIIDEIHMPNRPALIDVLGGSASFVTLGSRLFAKTPERVGCLLVAGDDFPETVREEIESWGTTLAMKKREGEKSTRGKLVYEDDTFGPKTFTYSGAPLRATPTDLLNTPLLHAKAFHFFGTPEEVAAQKPELLQLRKDNGIEERPFIVWEPLPASCTSINQQAFLSACKHVDVFSPNHLELSSIFSNPPEVEFDTDKLESYAQTILDSSMGTGGTGNIVIRAAEHGALSMSRTSRPTWLPAYYPKGAPEVVDTTGAGNAFLGGFIAGWQRTGDVRDAVGYGHVAASFAVEGIGLPKVERVEGRVVCNGAGVAQRLEEYKRKLGEASVKSERVL
ncbi:pfkB family kinase [Lentithecium fluviatile CBS 122367]|uniref:PfkB family kinase n=1 Tax=Lentithecium fluviatile CBS 122367 TaxID=1168545 RepID=A0A6G1ISC8_9PLEO|nr:pfkB family kinase [Lentithecium fluviatile CBS 122367]